MIKKGFNLFTSTGYMLEEAAKIGHKPCCDVCLTPSLLLCHFICKYRQATMGEYEFEGRN